MPLPRSEAQLIADANRTRDQVNQLGAPRGDIVPNPDLPELLRGRQARTPGALKLDIREKAEGGVSYVVAGQLLVPLHASRDIAESWLIEHGFTRRGISVDDPRGEALHDRVWVYSFEDGSDDDARAAVDDALAWLESQKIPAAPTTVAALQMVLKSAGGPGPTEAIEGPFTVPEGIVASANDPVIAVIDTGIDERLRGDGWLNEVGRRSNDNIDLLDVVPTIGTAVLPVLDLGAGHGTFVAGIIRQVEPLAKIVVYRALNTDGLASDESVAAAMIRAALDGADIIHLSLGMEAVNGIAPPAMQEAVTYIQSLRPDPPVIVAAAGNNGTDEKVYPAAFGNVVSVAALLGMEGPPGAVLPPADGEGAEWSTHGPWVTCSAVGEGVVSTFVKGEEEQQFGGTIYPEDSWAVWSGTSFAAPQISAFIARKTRENGGTPHDAVAAMLQDFPTAPQPDGFGTHVILLPGTRSVP